jgi:hypothetical protein
MGRKSDPDKKGKGFLDKELRRLYSIYTHPFIWINLIWKGLPVRDRFLNIIFLFLEFFIKNTGSVGQSGVFSMLPLEILE